MGPVLGETTSTVEELNGNPPSDLKQWLEENLGAFRQAS